MLGRIAVALALVVVPAGVNAGGGIGYSATDALGTQVRVVETRSLPGDDRGVMVSYSRKDGSTSMVEFGFRCAPMEFAYLGMQEEGTGKVPNLRLIREESDRLVGRGIGMLPVDTAEEPGSVGALAAAVCS